jgi:hypothetical protein
MTLADQALYLAKARGRNRVEVAAFEPAAREGAPQASLAPVARASERTAA